MFVIRGTNGDATVDLRLELYVSNTQGRSSDEIIASVEGLLDRLVDERDDENGIKIEGIGIDGKC